MILYIYIYNIYIKFVCIKNKNNEDIFIRIEMSFSFFEGLYNLNNCF